MQNYQNAVYMKYLYKHYRNSPNNVTFWARDYLLEVKISMTKEGRTSIHGLRPCIRALCEAAVPTSECRGRLRRYAPYKGLPPLAPLCGYPYPRL